MGSRIPPVARDTVIVSALSWLMLRQAIATAFYAMQIAEQPAADAERGYTELGRQHMRYEVLASAHQQALERSAFGRLTDEGGTECTN